MSHFKAGVAGMACAALIIHILAGYWYWAVMDVAIIGINALSAYDMAKRPR